MKKQDSIIYWVSTVLLSLMTVMGAVMYFVKNEMVSESFMALGYPAYIIYPLGGAKILAIIAILSKKSLLLKNLAYAGLFYTFILGAFSHIKANEGSAMGALVALALLLVSYHYDKKLEVAK